MTTIIAIIALVISICAIYEIEKLKKKGDRYVLIEIRSYNGYTFKEINSV